MIEPLLVSGYMVTGEVAIALPPGTVAAACDRALSAELTGPLTDAATTLGVVVAAAANKYARPIPGKDALGRTRYSVSGRAEGGRLVPDFNTQTGKQRRR